MGDIGQTPFRLRINITSLLYLIACLMSPAPLINLAESRASPASQNVGSWPLLVIVERDLFVQMMYTPSGGRALVQATVCHACTTSAQTAQLSRLPRRRCERSRGRTMLCLCACAWLCGLGCGVGRCRRTLGWSQCLSPT